MNQFYETPNEQQTELYTVDIPMYHQGTNEIPNQMLDDQWSQQQVPAQYSMPTMMQQQQQQQQQQQFLQPLQDIKGHQNSYSSIGSSLEGGEYSYGNQKYAMYNNSPQPETMAPLEITTRGSMDSTVSTSNESVTNVTSPIKSKTVKTKRKRTARAMTPVQRQSHNRIERKYRININSKIASLQRMVPWMSQDEVAFETHCSDEIKAAHASGKKLNKSMILDMVMEYVGYLQEEIKRKDEVIANFTKVYGSPDVDSI